MTAQAGKRKFEIVPVAGQKITFQDGIGYLVDINEYSSLIVGFVPDGKKTGHIRVLLRSLSDSPVELTLVPLPLDGSSKALKIYSDEEVSAQLTARLNNRRDISEISEPSMKPVGRPVVMTNPDRRGDALLRQSRAAVKESTKINEQLMESAAAEPLFPTLEKSKPIKLLVSSNSKITKDFKVDLPEAIKNADSEFFIRFDSAYESVKLHFREKR